MRIEWDEAKSQANEKKHGVSFYEAQQIFSSNTDYLEIYDQEHSDLEDRFIAIGPIDRGVVFVVWTERDEAMIRIISARWATRRERSLFHAYREASR